MSPQAQARLLDRLEREHGKSVRKAFEKAVRTARNRINFADLVRMIEARDIAGAMAVLGIGNAVYRDFEIELTDAFEKAGRAFTNLVPKNVRDPRGNRVTFEFDMSNRRAETLLRRHAADKVTEIAERQVETLRQALTAGMREGLNPRTTAVRIAGRYDRTTGRRVGSVIGLSGPQAGYLENARSYLEAGDARYFRLELRDRRMDAQIQAAMDAGRPVPAALRERALVRYSDRMVAHRAQVVARTETLNAIRAGKHEAIDQAVEVAGLPADAVEREWDASGDSRVRPEHAAADGQRVGKDQPFIVAGEALMYPGDQNGSPRNVTNCRCVEIARVDWNRASN